MRLQSALRHSIAQFAVSSAGVRAVPRFYIRRNDYRLIPLIPGRQSEIFDGPWFHIIHIFSVCCFRTVGKRQLILQSFLPAVNAERQGIARCRPAQLVGDRYTDIVDTGLCRSAC